MRVLLLSPYEMNLARIIGDSGDRLIQRDIRLSEYGVVPQVVDPDFIVMFGHRTILKDFLPHFDRKIINIHTSLLPWNRGANPNFWSWYDDTPKGISICFVNEGIDTGDIIASEQVMFGESETLRTSYNHLHETAEKLFERMWPIIRQGTTGLRQDPAHGSSHKKKDLEAIWPRLSKGWDTPVTEIMKMGVEARNAVLAK